MTRYVVVGAGAIGATLAAVLSDHADVVTLARGAALDHLSSYPLSFVSSHGRRSVDLTVVSADELVLRTDDVLIAAVKSQHVAEVARDLAFRPVTGSDLPAGEILPFVTTQNGLDAENTGARWFTHILGSTITIAARYTRVGEVRVGGRPHLGGIFIGEPFATTDTTVQARTAFAAHVRAAGFLVSERDDIAHIKGAKLLHNVRNALEVLAGPDEVKTRIGEALTAEARAVFDAAGQHYTDPSVLVLDPQQQGLDPEVDVVPGQQSTWQSFARGADSHEVDYLNGEIARLARIHGTSAPLNAAVQRLLGAAARNGGGLDLSGLDELVALASTASVS
ncbi:hypothetical protein KUG88_25070 [Rhodococcus rhodochrous]|uniref:ketopantoate reductase family protein n=1 Tax=Rhodococcus rhodochrous TaxID=1829 RepID=UPI001E57E4F4|nr:2-dehydropantoate 2-reductase N-terminal domain-containing protein [Rhodococcus rhodochrous]MCB8913394.1 hypothetical protein [Rhodococcus rhodochrous]